MDAIGKRARAIRAQQLIDDEVLNAALARLENDAIDDLASADLSDGLALQRYTAALQAARALKANLSSLVTTGKLAAVDAA